MDMRCASAIGLVLALAAPAWAAAATHVTATQTKAHTYTAEVSGGARPDGSDFSGSKTTSGASTFFDGFDTNLGVLVAANRSFDGTLSLRSNVQLNTNAGAFAVGQSAQVSANGDWGERVDIPAASHTVSCTTDQSGACFKEATTTIVADAVTRIEDVGALALFASDGPSTKAVPGTAQYQWEAGTSDQNGLVIVNNYLTLSGAFSMNYEYMDHANASFDPFGDMDVLALDFGTVAQGSAVGGKLFSLANLGDAWTVGLDLDSFTASGPGPFSTNLVAFSGLVAGGQRDFLAYFDTTNQGAFTVDYVLNLSDANVGVGLKSQQLTLRLTGVVGPSQGGCTGRQCPTSPTPEPATWAMMLAGFGVVGTVVRRQRRAFA